MTLIVIRYLFGNTKLASAMFGGCHAKLDNEILVQKKWHLQNSIAPVQCLLHPRSN